MAKKSLHRRLSAKCQVAVPVALLRQYHIRPGEKVVFEKHKDGILLKPAADILRDARGMLKGYKYKTAQELKDALRAEEAEYEKRKFPYLYGHRPR